LVEVESGKEAMTPAKRGGGRDMTTLGRLRNGLAADQGSRLIHPAFPVAQSRQRRSRQRTERLTAALAAVARQGVRPTPTPDVMSATMRAAEPADSILSDLGKQVRRATRTHAGERLGLRRVAASLPDVLDRRIQKFNRVVRFRQRQILEHQAALGRTQKPNSGPPNAKRLAVHRRISQSSPILPCFNMQRK